MPRSPNVAVVVYNGEVQEVYAGCGGRVLVVNQGCDNPDDPPHYFVEKSIYELEARPLSAVNNLVTPNSDMNVVIEGHPDG